MTIYKPTWLMIKQHNKTGLKYFCKTVRKNPHRYKGSGIYWTRHIKEHGNSISTIWCQRFDDCESLMRYAIQFSAEYNIVESKEWANLIPENGIDGAVLGHSVSDSTRQKLSEANRRRPPMSDEQKASISKSMQGKIRSPEHRANLSKSHSKISNPTMLTETKNKISNSLTGLTRPPRSPEHSAKLSASRKANRLLNNITLIPRSATP